MSGKKPSNVGFAIVRGFRGEMLYLASTHAGNGFRWLAGKQNAVVFASVDVASAVAERASREYGAKVTVVDMSPAPHIVERAAPAHLITVSAAWSNRVFMTRAQFEAGCAAYRAAGTQNLSHDDAAGLARIAADVQS